MTRAVRDRILKDANSDISDHLRNHIHLTNCIHLKNHMHKQSPILADRSLMRDLVVLQRSRSLKDPSMSPPSWHSPSATDLLPKRSERDAGVSNSRRSIDRQNNSRRLSGNSQILASSTSKVAPGDRVQERRRNKTDELIGNNFDLGRDVALNEVEMDSDDVASSSLVPLYRRQAQYDNTANKAKKRRKFRGSRTRRAAIESRETQPENEVSVASNSFSQAENEMNVTRDPRNGCGIPWNWSRIHNRGKTFLDSAGKSFSCGLSDPKLKRTGPVPQERDFSDMPMVSDRSSSSSKSRVEASPLLVDADNAAWEHDYSGELGIFADNLLKRGSKYDRHAFRGDRSGSRHQNLTQKYNPRSFRDLVGQNLVVQALTNAVAKRKIGLLYVFYGPHGTGKTSCAQIFARALNCQSLEHPKPCGLCDSCIANETGKSRNVWEVGPVSNFDFDRIMDLLEDPSPQYKVFIFDDCDALSPSCWNAISKVVDRAPKRVVLVLVSSSLDVLPHIIVSRCQRFFFPKLKDSDIIYTLQWIVSKEGLDIDKDALKLIVSRSDGSLRDAEMTLDQLTLLGRRISVPLVQELVGLISDEKLVDLLDLALSADTVNTVRNLREIMEMGVEPLALMSQLATVITDILAGSYDYMKERPRRKFFRRQSLSKEDMEKLRQALKILSEAEKQLRMSNDRLTWLTAALLQLAPDQQYLLPSSSVDTSFNHTPLGLNKSNADNADVSNTKRGFSSKVRVEKLQASTSSDRKRVGTEIEEIWLEVLDNIRINSVKEFMCQEGKLISVSFGAAPTVQLMFGSHLAKSRAEKFKKHILQGFESVLGSPLTIEIKYGSKKDERARFNTPLVLPVSQDGSSCIHPNPMLLNKDKDYLTQSQRSHFDSTGIGRSDIVEIEASPTEPKGDEEHINNTQPHKSSRKNSTLDSQRKLGTENLCKSIVKRKVSLAHVIQQAEGWSKRRGFSIAEKLEQENLRLEPRSRSLLCWKASRVTRRKISRLKIRARKPHALLKYVSCGKCLSARSPR